MGPLLSRITGLGTDGDHDWHGDDGLIHMMGVFMRVRLHLPLT